MNKNKIDLRVTKTKDALKSSFVDLIKQYPIEKITINHICSLANVNRITFYNHYYDKYDLFNNIISDETEKIKLKLNAETKDFEAKTNPTKYISSFIKLYIEVCCQNREFVFSVMTLQDNSILQFIFKNHIEKTIREVISTFNLESKLFVPLDLYVSFLTGGIYYITSYCISTDCTYSKEELMQYASIIIDRTVESFKNKNYSSIS